MQIVRPDWLLLTSGTAVTTLFWVIIVIAAVIFVGVEGFLIYTLVRY